MEATPALDSMLAPGRTLRPAGANLLSSLPATDQGAPYDRHAALYDRLIGSRIYNRLAWGTRPTEYRAFAAEALAAGEGAFLDGGCGTLVFTADGYRDATRPIVAVDRSLGMLGRAAERLHGGAPAVLVQADLMDLPFAPGQFDTVACFAMLHVLDDPWAVLAALRDQLAPGGRLFASMLVSDRRAGRAYMRVLRRAGEVGAPRSADELTAAARRVFGASAEVRRSGSMVWLRATAGG